MKIILSVSLIILIHRINGIHVEEELFTSCPELEGSAFAVVSSWLSTVKPYKGSKFFIASKDETRNDGLVEIESGNLSILKNNVFDVSLKTYIIIHGYKSHCQKPWVLEMKNQIFKNENANVILVDWREGSNSLNYIDSVRTTTKVSKDLFQLLQSMKAVIPRSKKSSPVWNHLHIIGHSLGAHIAGQTGYLLRKGDCFFKVERITGLDPAWPCFSKAPLSVKLDKQDADFVDVVHTQTSQDDKSFGLGLKTPSGHVDFYVNGGVMQPACQSSSFPIVSDMDDHFCSHRMAYRYFMESMNNTKSCPIEGYPWDQTHANAIQIFDNFKDHKPCNGCVELGKNFLNKVEKYGTYLVFTSAKAPYCSLKKGDLKQIEEKLKLLIPPKNTTSLLNLLFNITKSKKKNTHVMNQKKL